MQTAQLVLLVFAFVFFVIAAIEWPAISSLRLVAAGLACWVATLIPGLFK